MKHLLLLASLLLCASFLLLRPLPASAQNPDYPFQTQAFAADMTVTHVDPDRDRVQATGDNSKAYTLDTYRAAIVLIGTKRTGQTGDLVEGMRVHVAGTLVSSAAIVEADRVSVLPFHAPSAPPASPNAPIYKTPAPDNGQNTGGVTLRGTVESVDDRRGQFVVRVGDHTRTVRLTYDTDVSALPENTGHVPVRPGDRVTVAGTFGPNGSVTADAVSLTRTLRAIGPARRPPGLTGPVVATSDRLRSRDIKVRDGSGRDVTVHVPHNALVTRDGRPISIHELGKQDVVRVDGTPDGDAVRATAITVIGDVRDANP